jgi:hypothetical protein
MRLTLFFLLAIAHGTLFAQAVAVTLVDVDGTNLILSPQSRMW